MASSEVTTSQLSATQRNRCMGSRQLQPSWLDGLPSARAKPHFRCFHAENGLSYSDETDWPDLQSRLQILLLSRKGSPLSQSIEVAHAGQCAGGLCSSVHRSSARGQGAICLAGRRTNV